MADNNSHDRYGSAGSSSDHAGVGLFTLISVPVLRSVDHIEAARFFNDRERYGLEITNKQAEMSTLQATQYTAITDHSLLKQIMFIGSLNEIDPEATSQTLISVQIKEDLLGIV